MIRVRVSNMSYMNETVYEAEDPSSAGYDTIKEALLKAIDENIFGVGDSISIEDDNEAVSDEEAERYDEEEA